MAVIGMKLFIHLFINDWLLITVHIQTSTYTRTSSKMSGRKVNSNEIKLHGAALANNDKVSYCIACSPVVDLLSGTDPHHEAGRKASARPQGAHRGNQFFAWCGKSYMVGTSAVSSDRMS